MSRALSALGFAVLCLLIAACSCPEKYDAPTIYRGGAFYEDAVHR